MSPRIIMEKYDLDSLLEAHAVRNRSLILIRWRSACKNLVNGTDAPGLRKMDEDNIQYYSDLNQALAWLLDKHP